MFCCVVFVFFKQKTAYEMRISDWSSDVCSSDLAVAHRPCPRTHLAHPLGVLAPRPLLSGKPRLLCVVHAERADDRGFASLANQPTSRGVAVVGFLHVDEQAGPLHKRQRSEEHTSELQSLMRISYAVFCLKKKTNQNNCQGNKVK